MYSVAVTGGGGASRLLAFESWGPSHGYPIFLLHGTPGSRLGPRPRTRDLYAMGVRLIAYDRPGYGRSDRLEGRTVDHAAGDVAAIADHLGIPSFSVVGRSGGGPHAMACAALLPDRVNRAAVLVTIAPPDAEGIDWYEGMTASNISEYRKLGEESGLEQLSASIARRRSAINSDPGEMIKSLDPELTDSDRRIVAQSGIRTMLAANFAAAFRPSFSPEDLDERSRGRERASGGADGEDPDGELTGREGWLDDVVSFRRPWGFDPAQIKAPVLLWHGELDMFSPVGHFRWLAERIPDVTAVMDPNVAHFGAVPFLPKVLPWLADVPDGAALAARR